MRSVRPQAQNDNKEANVRKLEEQLKQLQGQYTQYYNALNVQGQKIPQLQQEMSQKGMTKLLDAFNDYMEINKLEYKSDSIKGRIDKFMNDPQRLKLKSLFYNTVIAIREVYTRKEHIKHSIQKLQERCEDLDENASDAESTFQQANEFKKATERKEDQKTLGLVKVHTELTELIKKMEEKNKTELEESEDIVRENAVKTTDIDFFVSNYKEMVDSLEKRISTLKVPTDDNQAVSFLNYIDALVADIKRRYSQYSSVMGMSFKIEQLQSQVKTLYGVLQEVQANYRNRYSELSNEVLHEIKENNKMIPETDKSYQDLLDGYNSAKYELDLYKNEIAKVTKFEEECSKEIANMESYRKRMETYESENMIKLYTEYKKLKDENDSKDLTSQGDKLSDIDNLKHSAHEAYKLQKEYMQNKQNPEETKRIIESFCYLIDNNQKIVNDLQKKTEQSKSNNATQVQHDLDEIIKNLRRPPKAEAEQLSEDFTNPDLPKYNEEHVEYNTVKDHNDRYIVEWATTNVFVKLLFHKENKEPIFRKLNVFACHNSSILQTDQNGFICTNVFQLIKDIYEKINTGNSRIFNDKTNVDINFFGSRVYDYIMNWVKMFPLDFKKEENSTPVREILDKINNFIDVGPILAEIDAIKKDENYQGPVLKLKYPVTEKKIAAKNETKLHMQYAPSIVAMHMMYVDYEIFRKISYREYLQCFWSSKANPRANSPNLCDLTERFNKISTFVQYTIVSQPGYRQAAASLKAWIDIMDECFKLNYFNALFAIDGALSAPAVLRLQKTWKEVGQYQAKYNKLSRVCSPLKKFKDYKINLQKCDIKKALPYVGPWLTDMTFIKDGNPKSKMEGNDVLFNIVMHRAYFAAASYLAQPWGVDVKYEIDPHVVELFRNLEISEVHDETDLNYMSRRCEK